MNGATHVASGNVIILATCHVGGTIIGVKYERKKYKNYYKGLLQSNMDIY